MRLASQREWGLGLTGGSSRPPRGIAFEDLPNALAYGIRREVALQQLISLAGQSVAQRFIPQE
jgi:hypothetical protein